MTERRWAHRHRLTVRFSDCDLLGHVNNAVYLTYFEECRVAWWRELGGSTTLPGGIGVILVLATHSLVDYPLRTTALSVVFALACALCTRPLGRASSRRDDS